MKPDSPFNKVLITGINGFTGVHLEHYLKNKGFDVYGTVIGMPESAKHFHCDIVNKDDIDTVINEVKPEYIIHIAAISFVAQSNPSLFYSVNVIGTENILQSLIDHNMNPKKVIVASSATVYGNQNKEVLDESMCPKPINHYGASKLAMECMVSNFFDRLNIIITRPFNYTGAGQESHFLIPKIVSHFKENKAEIELGNIHVAREFNAISMVTEIYYKLLLCDAKSTIVNICSGHPIKLLDVIEMMNQIAGYEIDVKVNPVFVRANEIDTLSGSIEKLTNIIGNIEKVAFSKTLRDMLEA